MTGGISRLAGLVACASSRSERGAESALRIAALVLAAVPLIIAFMAHRLGSHSGLAPTLQWSFVCLKSPPLTLVRANNGWIGVIARGADPPAAGGLARLIDAAMRHKPPIKARSGGGPVVAAAAFHAAQAVL